MMGEQAPIVEKLYVKQEEMMPAKASFPPVEYLCNEWLDKRDR